MPVLFHGNGTLYLVQNDTAGVSSMRLNYVMIRVTDLDRSTEFYTDIVGMQLLERREEPEGNFSVAYLGFPRLIGSGVSDSIIKLSCNHIDNDVLDPNIGFVMFSCSGGQLFQKLGTIMEKDESIIVQNTIKEANFNGLHNLHKDTERVLIKDPDGYLIEFTW